MRQGSQGCTMTHSEQLQTMGHCSAVIWLSWGPYIQSKALLQAGECVQYTPPCAGKLARAWGRGGGGGGDVMQRLYALPSPRRGGSNLQAHMQPGRSSAITLPGWPPMIAASSFNNQFPQDGSSATSGGDGESQACRTFRVAEQHCSKAGAPEDQPTKATTGQRVL